MKIETYKFPKSSFLSLEKDYAIIVDKMLKNERLKKLLHYDTPDALSKSELSAEETLDLINNKIKIVPKIQIDNSIANYIIITFNNFSPTENPEFRDNDITFDIVCHLDSWLLKDFQLRPYKIAGEIDEMFNEQRLTGIGKLEFLTANQITFNADYGMVTLMYRAIHGEDDKKGMLNPADEENFINDFNEMYNL